MNTKVQLVVSKYLGGQCRGTFQFPAGPVTIGRNPQAMVRLEGPDVSSEHALLHFTDKSCLVEDSGSRNGVFVAGRRVDSHLLRATEEIQIGAYVLRISLRPAADKVQARPIGPPTPPGLARRPALPSPPLPLAQGTGTRGGAEATPEATEVEIDLTAEGTPEPVLDDDTSRAEAAPGFDHVENADDEDEDEDPSPLFSLLDTLNDGKDEKSAAGKPLIQAITTRQGRVSQIDFIAPGKKLRHKGLKRPLCTYRKNGSAILVTPPLSQGGVFPVNAPGPEIAHLPASNNHQEIRLEPGQRAALELASGDTVHFRFVTPATKPLRARLSLRPRRQHLALPAASALLHVVVLLAIALTPSQNAGALLAPVEPPPDRFATISLEDLTPKVEPEPEPEPVPEPEAPAATPEPEPEPETPVQAAPRPEPRPREKSQTKLAARPSPAPPTPAKNKLLDALGSSLPGESSSKSALATINLDAVATPRGGGYRVVGTVGKLASDSITLTASAGRLPPKSMKAADSTVGRIASHADSGRVRAVVKSPPARSVSVQGELDRGEIQKVVNRHLQEIQACYERRLIRSPGLAGKLIFEWQITPSGSTGVVRVKLSQLRDGEVATCIQGSIRKWVFPKPRGGAVTVTYPFVFNTIGT
ncbi:MAG: AgmX/PglI C-terminal domain-containing protein [Deltaproteobacteria bacterium]|nr:AgmX/PglI C-terminal domain-containing protein [Deltaproteobacteria bacterium]